MRNVLRQSFSQWQVMGLERLEGRRFLSVTPSVANIREATGADAAAIQAAVDAFRADLGGANNGNTPGAQASGQRAITWDGADNDAAPARLPGDFFNAIAPRGALINGGDNGRIQFQVSADDTNPTPTLSEFGNVNPTYQTAFGAFSAPRLFSALNSNVYDVDFVVPGTLDPATVSGFGVVFTDVDVAGSSKVEYFDSHGNLVFSRDALATAGDASFSFLGVKFVGTPIAKVRITSGSAALGEDDVTQGGQEDIVVVDDFLYGEPKAFDGRQIAVASGGKGAPQVRIINGDTGAEVISFLAYDAGFRGGVRVATGDVNGDGVWDVVTAPGKGTQQPIRIFSGVDWTQVGEFTAFDPAFRGGLNVAVANINGDANADIVVALDKGAAKGGDRQVRVFSGLDEAELASFNAFPGGFRGGVTVAAGDINGDFVDDVIVGRATGGSQVRIVDGAQLASVDADGNINAAAVLRETETFGNGFRGGVNVAAGDVNGDGVPDVVAGSSSTGSQSRVRTFSGADGAQLRELTAFESRFNGGVRVAVGDVNGDGLGDIVTGAGPGAGPHIRNAGVSVRDLDSFLGFDPGFKGGVFVALLD